VTIQLEFPQAIATARRAHPRRYLMCPPEHFTVAYVINPWMSTDGAVDTDLALSQWNQLRRTYLDLGHSVEVIPAVPGLPDMVFAANGGLVIDGTALSARFVHAERAAEGPAYLEWMRGAGLTPAVEAEHVNEGEGDLLVVGSGTATSGTATSGTGRRVLAGTGFRTVPAAHDEVARLFGLPVVSLELVDPRFYHLDTALAVLDDTTIAYFPAAFSERSRRVLAELYPDAVLADEADACVLGLNAVSDGYHVVLAERAVGLMAQLRERGFAPIGVDLSELLKAGGGAKCCTLELRA
jgi:N-dimethylarginine dimethylaminohydrolase